MSFLSLCTVPIRAENLPEPQFDMQRGVWVATIGSKFQSTASEVEILLPSSFEPGKKYPVLYILPVGRRNGDFGDGMVEAKKSGLADKLQVICVSPSFSMVPWYGNHATDPAIRQEDFLVHELVPYMDGHYPAVANPDGRWLVGFSKSGWGAVTLLLRHPDVFGFAAAWDAPFMIDGSGADWGPMGLKKVFGTREQMLKFLPTTLAVQNGETLGARPRLVIGPGKFWEQHGNRFHQHLNEHRVPHIYREDLLLPHRWDSGWFGPMVEELAEMARPPTLP